VAVRGTGVPGATGVGSAAGPSSGGAVGPVGERLDPQAAAYWAIIGICLVLIGALLTPGTLSIENRATVLAGIVGVLLVIGRRGMTRRQRIERIEREREDQ
jgi:hypothetical protein